jgi:hypothetical protein
MFISQNDIIVNSYVRAWCFEGGLVVFLCHHKDTPSQSCQDYENHGGDLLVVFEGIPHAWRCERSRQVLVRNGWLCNYQAGFDLWRMSRMVLGRVVLIYRANHAVG